MLKTKSGLRVGFEPSRSTDSIRLSIRFSMIQLDFESILNRAMGNTSNRTCMSRYLRVRKKGKETEIEKERYFKDAKPNEESGVKYHVIFFYQCNLPPKMICRCYLVLDDSSVILPVKKHFASAFCAFRTGSLVTGIGHALSGGPRLRYMFDSVRTFEVTITMFRVARRQDFRLRQLPAW